MSDKLEMPLEENARLRAENAKLRETLHDWNEESKNWFAAGRVITELRTKNERLRSALEKVMVAGNHLVDVIGVRHPAAGSTHDYVLSYYGPGNKYDVWCCWNTIMEARVALEEN